MDEYTHIVDTALDNISSVKTERVTGIFYVLHTVDGKLACFSARDPQDYYVLLASAHMTVRRLEALIHGMEANTEDDEGRPN
jgi:hypothetical protein